MPATDTEQLIREAIVGIADAHVGLQTVLGRATNLIVERDTTALDVGLPVLAYDFLTYEEGTGRCELLLTAVADGVDAGAKCRAILEQAKLALTWAAFNARSLQLVVMDGIRRSVDEVGDIRDRLRFEVVIDAPTLTQSDWMIPLLVVE